MSFGDRAFSWLQYLLPKHLMSRFITRSHAATNMAAQYRAGIFLRASHRYGDAVNLIRIAIPRSTLLYARAKTRSAAIAQDSTSVVSPVDGTVSQAARSRATPSSNQRSRAIR